MADTLRASLFRLNRARLITAVVVPAVGGVLRQDGAFPYAFGPFELAVLGAVAACAILPAALSRIRDPRAFARLQLALDVVLVSAIVATSGGARSVFVPLYVLTVVAASFVLSQAGAFAVASLSSVFYVAVVLGREALAAAGVLPAADTTTVERLAIFLNAAVFLVVGFVTSSLADRYRESQEHLDTHRKHLSDLQAFHGLIFDSVGSGLVAVDARGRVTAFNRAAESITGFQSADALGQPWSAIFGDGVDLDEIRETADEPQAPPRRYEFPLKRHDGRVIPIGISFWSLRSGQGEVAGLIGVCQDLSTIKRMEQRMRQADRLATVGRLSANMAHEIRNPLASISGAVEALAKELPPDEGRDRLVEIVLKESERLNHLVAAFLEYARPAPLTPLDVNLAEILDEVLLLIEHRSLPANLKIIREYAESLPARVDPQQMRQAIWNLCLNAVQAMPDGGEVRVGGRELDDPVGPRIQVWIADTGHGIADEDLPHIFEPFYSTKAGGSGIGLALVYRVLQDHGGLIEARSRPGDGTTFTLALPAAHEPQNAVLPTPTTRRP
jgi:two-component system sensor histidine kinase PilS (NtrC family)